MSKLLDQQTDRSISDELDTLLNEVLTRHVEPEDLYEIAAILESEGFNDARVMERFGYFSVFDLSRELWNRHYLNVSLLAKAEPEKVSLYRMIADDLRQFIRGTIFALPMVLSIVAMLSIKFSLWSYINLSIAYATAIAIGTFLSFATVGGFMQSIARRSYLYVTLGYYKMARKVTYQLIRYGFIMSILVTVAYLAFNLMTNIMTPVMMFLSISYYLVMNAIWLAVTAMYVLRKELIFTGLIIVGIGLVYLFFVIFHIYIIYAQLISMLIVSAISLLIVWRLFKNLERLEEPGTLSQPTKTSIAFYSIWPYFVYGSAYFMFLFIDRVMSWSTNEIYMPFYIWFRTRYELGLDFALFTMVIPMGVAEVVITKMMRKVEWSQKNYLLNNIQEMNHTFRSDFFRLYRMMVVVSVLSAIAIYLLVNWLTFHLPDAYSEQVFGEIRTYIVFYIALLSYAIVSVSLLNSVVMFSLSEPMYALRATLNALGIDALVGFVFSRWLGSDFAVVGLLVGSILFLLMTTKAVYKVLDQLDYYLYQIS